MARQVRQTLPDPPPQYDQDYIASLARALNAYMGQAQALAEVIAGRFIMTDPLQIPGDLPDTGGLPLGTLYLKIDPVIGPVLSVVLESDVLKRGVPPPVPHQERVIKSDRRTL